ncbi:MAG TPA: hypothetical protein VJW94_15000 [Candidatus Acidoferrum sp.]|nr:hypothetical protein [Candidatus Acidoferrum sp.]
MIRMGFAILAGALLAAVAAAQTEPSVVSLPSGTAVNAELNSSVDSKKAKVGDKVEAHTTEEIKFAGKTIVPRGAKLEGHVTEATARSKGDSGSTLAIQFDKAILKKGEEIPLNVAILAIAAPLPNFAGGSPGTGSDSRGGGSAPTGNGSPMGTSHTPTATPATPSNPGGAADSTTGPNGAVQLSAKSRGVYGLNDLKLMAVSSSASQATIIVSSGKNVHLDGGTRLLLVVPEQAAAAPSK